jgi:hypothetical protein
MAAIDPVSADRGTLTRFFGRTLVLRLLRITSRYDVSRRLPMPAIIVNVQKLGDRRQ